jgi:hypothetical protein
VTCGQSPYQYSNLSRVKYDVARYHLGWFRKVVTEFPDVGFFWRIGGDNPQSRLWAHGDGCAFQLYGAFDAFSCGIAHRLELPRPEEASFNRMRLRISEQAHPGLVHSIEAISGAAEWSELEELRHRAAHRGVLGQYVWSGPATPGPVPPGRYVTRVYLDPQAVDEGTRREALPVLTGLVSWAEGPLRWLWNIGETWRKDHEPTAIGTIIDLDVGGLPVPKPDSEGKASPP